MSAPLSQQSCLANGGVYAPTRLYLSGSMDGDGFKDYNQPLYLKDNFQYNGDASSTPRLALVSVPNVATLNGGTSI